jgi:uncharacterized protein YggE
MVADQRAASLAQAERAVKTAENALLGIVREQGVAPADIDAASYSLEPLYDAPEGKRLEKRLGFRVQRRFTVVVRDLSRVSALVSRIAEAGVVSIESVRPETTDTRGPRAEVRLQAVRAAREKAQAIATELGQELGKATSVEVDGASPCGTTSSGSVSNYRNFSSVGTTVDSDENLGRITLTARVKVVFELK